MYIRALSPESTNCCGSLAPLAALNSSDSSQRTDDGGRDKFSSSPLYSSVSSVNIAADGAANDITRRDGDLAPLRRVENDFFLPRVDTKCQSKSNCYTDNRTDRHVVEEEDRIVNFASPCQSGLDVQRTDSVQTCCPFKEEQLTDSNSVLQHKWSASSSTDSIKSINQENENEEGRNRDQFSQRCVLDESSLFYRSLGAQRQQPGSSIIGLHRKWSDSSCSLDSIDQEEEDKNTQGCPGARHDNNPVGFKGSSGLTDRKWSSSNCSLDSIDSEEEEDNGKFSTQFPPLIEPVRVKQSSSASTHRNGKEGPVLSSSSSSIGNRSEDSSGSVISDADSPVDMEVESTFRSGSVSQLSLSSLESSLPIRRGLSRFWNGKAKSFASLQDVLSLASIADFAKPENPFNKRRRFPSAAGIRPSSPLNRPNTAGISKRPPSGSGKSCLAIAVAMGNKMENEPKSLSPQSALRNAQRSFSLSDLGQHGSNTDTAPPPATMTRMRRS